MNDLISRSALMEAFGEEPLVWDSRDREDVQMHNDWLDYTKLVKEAPAVDAETVFEAAGLVKEAFGMAKADLVAVVRCKDCKWLCSGFDTYSCAKHTGLALIKPDGSGFCSYGERRADECMKK